MSEQDELLLHLRYIGALCERAIAFGWQSGRLSFPAPEGLPFQTEVAAILHPGDAHAQPAVQAARQRAQELAAEVQRRRQAARALAATLGSADGSHFASLDALAQRFGLTELAVEILVILAAPRLWGELARLYGIASNDPNRPLCDELLVCQLLAVPIPERWRIARELSPDSALLRHGLVSCHGEARPFAELTVDPIIASWLQGDRFEELTGTSSLEPVVSERALNELVLPPGLAAEVARELDSHPQESRPLRLVVRGRLGSGRRTLMAALAQRLGSRLAMINLSLIWQDRARLEERLRSLLRQVALRGWLPCIDNDSPGFAGDDEVLGCLREALRHYPGPLFVRASLESPSLLQPGYLSYELVPLRETQRAEVFRTALREHGLNTAPAESAANKYRIGAGTIRKVVAQVAQQPLADPATLQPRLEAALRQHRNSQIGALATPVTRLSTWSQVVLPDDIADSVQEFIGRICQRRKVFEQWGMDRVMTSSRGFTALFQGGPGTGKSMVAGLIAHELGYDLYRVDVSRILSRWIGETEQNLARLFDAAEDGQVIILFDEADALFSKRTEVRTSVDRYANVQVNYLLQRLDSFEGIAILTTNQGTGIDAAFKRRLSMRLTFPFPDERMRRDLWRVHIPESLPVADPLDIERLAETYELSGGYIRNAVLRSAFLAAQDGMAVTQAHLERAVRLEYQEAGKLFEGGVLE